MTYEQFKGLKPSAFKRRCGVHLETSLADGRCAAPPEATVEENAVGSACLSVEDQLLLVLE